MGKKNKTPSYLQERAVNRKAMNKQMDDVLKEIEFSRMQIYEIDKRSATRKNRKGINQTEAEFFHDMDSIRCREKISKRWKKKGILETIIEMLNNAVPMIKTLARAIANFITLFLSIPFVKEKISPKFIKRLTMVFDLAMSV